MWDASENPQADAMAATVLPDCRSIQAATPRRIARARGLGRLAGVFLNRRLLPHRHVEFLRQRFHRQRLTQVLLHEQDGAPDLGMAGRRGPGQMRLRLRRVVAPGFVDLQDTQRLLHGAGGTWRARIAAPTSIEARPPEQVMRRRSST